MILLHQLPECWESKCDLLCPVSLSWGSVSTRVTMTVVWTALRSPWTLLRSRSHSVDVRSVSETEGEFLENPRGMRLKEERERMKPFLELPKTHWAFCGCPSQDEMERMVKVNLLPHSHVPRTKAQTLSFPDRPATCLMHVGQRGRPCCHLVISVNRANISKIFGHQTWGHGYC